MSARYALRMIAPLAAISGLLLLVGGGGAWYVHRLSRDVSGVSSQNIESLLASEHLVLAARDLRMALNQYLSTGRRADLDAALDLRQESEAALNSAERSAVGGQTKHLIGLARDAHERFYNDLQHRGDQPTPADAREVNQLAADLTDGVLAASVQLLEHNRAVAATDSARNRELADRVGLGLLLLGICGAVAGVLAGFAMARGFSRSIVQLSLPVRDTAGKLGEVVGPIDLSAKVGLVELETVMRTIAEETSAVVTRLQESQREVVRREQLAAAGQLAAGLAHELRNPLMSMKILVQAAAADPAALTAHDLDVLAEEITRLEQLTRTFLDFARPQEPARRVFDVRDLIAQTMRVISGRSAQQNVVVASRLPDEPLLISADSTQIRQVVLNLLLNALDAMPGGGEAKIEVFRQPGWDSPHNAPADTLVLRVSDQGPGLPAELGERIFEPFVSTRGTGMGLGLSICRRIIEDHGGTIEAANGVRGGAEFTLRLPLAGEADAESVLSRQGALGNVS